MSTNSSCELIQTEADKWYYVLEDYNAPKNAWDWRKNASACGPFKTKDAAKEHLHDNHANPGGNSTYNLPEGVEKLDLSKDAVLAKLIAEAVPANPPRRNSGYFR